MTRNIALTVNNLRPTGLLIMPNSGVQRQDSTFQMMADDPSPVDAVSPFTYLINWGDGSPVETKEWSAGGFGGNGDPLFVPHAYERAGTYTVTFVCVDKDGGQGNLVRKTHTVSAARLVTNPVTGKQDFLVGGTRQRDAIKVTPHGQDEAKVTLNGENVGTFCPTGRIEIHGYDGDDKIEVVSGVRFDAWLFGETGDDGLTGARGTTSSSAAATTTSSWATRAAT